MKTYDERMKDIHAKLSAAKRKRAVVLSAVSLCCCMALILGILLIPQPTPEENPKVVLQAQNYAPLIEKLSALVSSGEIPGVDLEDGMLPVPDAAPVEPPSGSGITNGTAGKYEEVTDIQVQGVIEADLIKRSDRHIFYLYDGVLRVYTIDGQESKELSCYELGSELGEEYRVYSEEAEMYLSADCKTIVIMAQCYNETESQRYLYLLSLNVAYPQNIRVNGSLFLNGQYHTSRLSDGTLYVISRFYVPYSADFEDKSTFLPGYGTPEEMQYLPMKDICIPEEPTSAMYTVVTKLEAESLKVKDSAALLSSTGAVYMSRENIYLTRGFSDSVQDGQLRISRSMTEITRLSVTGNGLSNEGTICVNGSVKDQYSLDEQDGILRVVTTINETRMREFSDEFTTGVTLDGTVSNASLYCIDLEDHGICAQVECFAPEGEAVRSVRFDGDNAYVCTSIVLQDPVFFFDLSDLKDIQYKDTGTIDGYSMSLVDFGDGFLMGFGYDGNWDKKIEMYRETETAVVSHCAYERSDWSFPDTYKSYYIDRENQLIGLPIWEWGNDKVEYGYLLLHFDGYEFRTLLEVAHDGTPEAVRAVYIDGYLYIFGEEFQIRQVK